VGTGFSSPSGDIHNSIALLVRSSDQKLLLVESAEAMGRPFARVSSSPLDPTAWASAYNILSASGYTYPSLVETPSAIYLLIRQLSSGVYYMMMSSSVDGGANWDTPGTNIIAPVTGGGNPGSANYWRLAAHVSRIHFFVTDTERTDAHPSSVFHMYFEAGVMYASDGTSLGSSWPIAATAGTLVQDASDGPCWSEGVAFDGSGNPSTVLLTYDAGNTRNQIKHARWTGSAWVVNDVAHSNGRIGGNRFIAGAAIAKANPYAIYANVKVGSFFELHRYTSTDSGAAWTAEQLTTGSTEDNAMPDTPKDAGDVGVVWGRGTYTSDSNFDFIVYVAG
jgi:hypothetical protein